jgi:hypothetical protein
MELQVTELELDAYNTVCNSINYCGSVAGSVMRKEPCSYIAEV